jgi:NAD(P) transhydrogenase subunit alpha
MVIGVPKETAPGERRVALVPETVGRLTKAGLQVAVERDAGTSASFLDSAYEEAGGTIVPDAQTLYGQADVIAKVAKPTPDEIALMRPGTMLIGFLAPLGDPASVERLADRKLTAMSMETIPRITRAQSMDALSSQSNVAGYKAVILGAEALPKFFPMLTTAAGTIPPAKVLVIGAGVAGLQAIATARRLGAIVSAYDTRAAVKEQVQSLGAGFLEIDLGIDAEAAGGYARELTAEQLETQRRFMVKTIGDSDVVITTAAVPGRPAPKLITREAIAAMKPGAVIVDLAAETGGNSELTEPGAVITTPNGVTIIGTLNLPSTMPYHSSQLYSRNVQTLLNHLIKDGKTVLDFDDEITRGACLTHDGKILHESTLAALSAEPV